LPELLFVITAAKKKNNWLVLGAVIGDVILLPTLGLGLIAIISPIRITAFPNLSYLILFLAFTSFLFLFFIRSGKKISLKEAVILLSLYFLFVIIELFFLRF